MPLNLQEIIKLGLVGSGGGSSGGGSSGGGMWMQTGTIVFESDMSLGSAGWGIQVDDSAGKPDLIYMCRDVEATDNSHENYDFFSVIAAPSILKKVYYYGYLWDKYNLPAVADNSSAIYKDDKTGLYYPTKPAWALGAKIKAGVAYRWIAIGGISA